MKRMYGRPLTGAVIFTISMIMLGCSGSGDLIYPCESNCQPTTPTVTNTNTNTQTTTTTPPNEKGGYVLPGFSSEESARARVVWEAARAMVGPTAADGYTWPTGTNYAGYAYVAEDRGAWDSLRVAYTDEDGMIAGDLTCRSDDNLIYYTPCLTSYGSTDPNSYGYQPDSSSTTFHYRGGQCKAFTNLIAYRSGVLHGDNWAFKKLPYSGNVQMSSSNIRAGDILRSNSDKVRHSLIVTRVFTENGITKAVVIDSNWVTGNGGESIGTHVLAFDGSNGNSNLANYYAFQCVYDGNC